MTEDDFGASYSAALRQYLNDGTETNLEAGHLLGRRAVRERLGVSTVVAGHLRAVERAATGTPQASRAAALDFLLRALATFDAPTDTPSTKRYQQQRVETVALDVDTDTDLAWSGEDGDAFRRALVNSLQEGFFVIDRNGTIVEVNEAFAAITGCGFDGLPYRWPYPWVVDATESEDRLGQLRQEGSLDSETRIRHRDGRVSWAAVSINSVTEVGGDHGAYVGTIRDVTTKRSDEVRRSAVVRLATALGVATSVSEVLDILLDVVATAIEVQRVVAVLWAQPGSAPAVRGAGPPAVTTWSELDPRLRDAFDDARDWPPLAVVPVQHPDGSDPSAGMMTVLSGAENAVLWLEYSEPRATSDEDRVLVAALIGHLSAAVQHVRQFETAREASLTLQRTMMPTTKPPVGFAVRYEPAVSPLEIGGDWYDVLAIDDHQIGVIVGDCVGSGLSAAAVMGQLRSSARVLLINGAAPARLLDQLDPAAALIPGAYCATVFVCTIDTDTGAMTYSSAGHVPALLAVPDATPEALTDATSVPLAVQKSGPRPEATISLPPGSTLLLYTDGLVERRDGLLDDGIEHVGRVLAEFVASPAEAVADALLIELAPREGFDDDVAIVVYRRPPAPLDMDVPATPDQLSDIRARLGHWLRATGIPDDLAGDIVLVVNEACTNSIEHGYRGMSSGRVLVYVEAKGRGICIRVDDFGSWKPPDANPRVRGRGVPLMRAVSGDVTLDGTATGTTVVLTFQLG